MAKVPTIDVFESNEFDTTSEGKATHVSSISHRSSSVTLSMRSSRSRSTLVGYDEDLEYKLDTTYGTTGKVKDFTCLDHLLKLLCIKRGGRESLAMTTVQRNPEQDEDIQSSPWILPVYVLSIQKDESRHFIPKEAKCTIDTGNLQGNLVSKTFVTDILGYPESSFQPLTKAEEAGGTGVTGHKLVPQAAISLTWYHSKSTRVFRDMRFLISEHPMYDLIIGSPSIHQNRILDVPNLMAGPNLPDIVVYDEDEELEKHRRLMNEKRLKFAPLQREVDGPKQSKDADTVTRYGELKLQVANTEQKFKEFHIKRYWDKFKENPKDPKLVKYREAWQEDFPGEKMPSLDVGPQKATGQLQSPSSK